MIANYNNYPHRRACPAYLICSRRSIYSHVPNCVANSRRDPWSEMVKKSSTRLLPSKPSSRTSRSKFSPVESFLIVILFSDVPNGNPI